MTLNGWNKWLSENMKLVAGALIALVVVLGAFGVYRDRVSKREATASSVLYETRAVVQKDINIRKFDAAVEKYQDLMKRYPGTRAAYEARLIVGDIWMDAEMPEKAAAAYADAFSVAPDDFSRLLARYNESQAWESGAKWDKALDGYQSVLKFKGADVIKPDLLMAQGRCLEAMKRFSEARGVYEEIRKSFSDKTFYSNAATAFLNALPSGA